VLKKRLIITLKILIALAVFGWVGWELYKSWGKIQQVHWEPHYLLLILSGICYAVAYIPAAIFWRHAMRTLGQQPGVYETFRAYYIGHLGKYVPGKAMVLVIRPGLLNHKRTKISAAAASVFVETMTMMAVGAFVAATIVLFWFRQDGHHIDHENWLMLLTVGIMCGTMLPILPPVFHFVAKKCRVELEGLRFRTLAVGWMLNIPVWIMLGVSYWLTMQGLGMQSNAAFHDILFCTLAVSMAMVFGFATPIPGGLGARELVGVFLLVPFFQAHPQTIGVIAPEAMAFAVVTVQRVISILSELTVSALLSLRFAERATFRS
jgi:uncharacterized membrane protein YbhN (UPF0104 family)